MKFALLFVLLWGELALGASPNFRRMTGKNFPCARELKAHLGASLEKQTWRAQAIAIPNADLAEAVVFRDTRVSKAYWVWKQERLAVLQVEDFARQKETRYVWDQLKACRLAKTDSELKLDSLPVAEGYTDDKLRETLKSHDWGVIYVWTPYMPYSMDAIKEIRDAAKSMKGHVVVLLDPMAEVQVAQKAVDRGQAEPGDLTRVASRELMARDLGLHYPIAFIYKDGFLSNRSYVGYKKSAMYAKWFKLELENLKKDLK